MNENELQPWIVVQGDADTRTLAMWRLSELGQPALALFSDAPHAEHYATAHISDHWEVSQPARAVLLRIMIECFQQQIELAVLDPDQDTARRIFKLRDVLKAARQELS